MPSVDISDATFVRTGNASGLQRAATLAEGPYGRPNPMRHYVYLRASQKEPWNIVYFTPALTTIVNVVDHSFVLIRNSSTVPERTWNYGCAAPCLWAARGRNMAKNRMTTAWSSGCVTTFSCDRPGLPHPGSRPDREGGHCARDHHRPRHTYPRRCHSVACCWPFSSWAPPPLGDRRCWRTCGPWW